MGSEGDYSCVSEVKFKFINYLFEVSHIFRGSRE